MTPPPQWLEHPAVVVVPFHLLKLATPRLVPFKRRTHRRDIGSDK